MKSRTTQRFRRSFAQLPANIQDQARQAFATWRRDPSHPSLQFKPIHTRDPIYAARIGIHWRALAVMRDDAAVWFWIGPHSEYDTLVSRL
jgi:hypothetical protein